MRWVGDLGRGSVPGHSLWPWGACAARKHLELMPRRRQEMVVKNMGERAALETGLAVVSTDSPSAGQSA